MAMVKAKVTNSVADFGLHQVILCKLKYPLVAMAFNHNQCNDIMHPILTAGLLSARCIKMFPRAIVHGPWQWSRLNIPHLYIKQLTTHIHTLLKFVDSHNDQIASLIQAVWEGFRMETGLNGSIFDFTDCIQGYMILMWLTHTCSA